VCVGAIFDVLDLNSPPLSYSGKLSCPVVRLYSERCNICLVQGLCDACGSNPADRTEGLLGAYLVTVMFQVRVRRLGCVGNCEMIAYVTPLYHLAQTSCVSSAMFLTAMAANPLCLQLAQEVTGVWRTHAAHILHS
jgi:di/tricarboxylate transporter